MGGEPQAQAQAQASRLGLARYRSAPATWLEALLESDIEDQNNHNNNSISNTNTTNINNESDNNNNNSLVFESDGFFRQNSTPAGFGSDSYFSTTNYQMSIGGSVSVEANYDFAPSPSSSNKRLKGDAFSSSLLKEEDQSEHLERGLSGLLDPEMEKLLEDSVPCRVRAKRGCATHPRSIAERVRRTRISDRIRKLQELVPNMEKQTNTADMLEEAVEYVKLLQKQIQELTEQQKNCKCVQKE